MIKINLILCYFSVLNAGRKSGVITLKSLKGLPLKALTTFGDIILKKLDMLKKNP